MQALLSFLLIFSLNVWGVTEVQVPALTSPVMDEAGFLSEAERADLSQLAYEINANNGPQITILTVNNLQDFPIEDFSIKVAEKWQLGTKEKDNGLLIVIAKAERKMRIEVGGGIEGEITDYESNQYIRDVLTPAFREGQFHAGLKTVLLDVAKKFNIQQLNEGTPIVRRAPQARALPGPLVAAFPFLIGIVIFGAIFLRKRPMARGLFTGAGMAGVGAFVGAAGLATILFMFIIGLFIGLIGLHNLLFALAAGGGRGMRGGGGFGGGGGGGWGGGGGGFSGGGSSGSW